jgi:SAM-dependent methyltransferase
MPRTAVFRLSLLHVTTPAVERVMSNMTALADAAAGAYDQMAPFYDRFTAHHDYDAWTGTLEALARDHGLAGRRLLDVGCGTGKSFLPFLRRGYDVVACDVSPRMAALAAEKAPHVPVHVCDVRALPALGEFDLVCCLDDALNHLLEPGELTSALAAIAGNLAAEGIALFDVNTLATYRTFFASTSVEETDELVSIWAGRSSPAAEPGVLAEAVFTAFWSDGGSWSRARVTHLQRHHPARVILDAIAAAGLDCVGVYGHGLDGVPHDGVDELADTKAVYLARRAR